MSDKLNKIANLLQSSTGGEEVKESMIEIERPYTNVVDDLVQVAPKVRTNFELDADLHKWLKVHAVSTNRNMVDIVVEQLRRYRREVEGR